MRQIGRVLWAVLVMAMLTGTSFAGDAEVEKLLDLLVAKKVITQEDAMEFRSQLKTTKSGSETDAVIAQTSVAPSPVASAAATSKAPSTKNEFFNITGYVQGRFTEAPDTTNTFEIRRARLIFDGKLTDDIAYQVQIDGVKPQLLDAKVEFKPVQSFGVTIGQFKIPFSTESYTSDNLLQFVERSTVVNSFAPGRDNSSNGRDIGLQFSGKTLRVNGSDRLEYFAGVFNGAGLNVKDDNHYKDTAARVVVRPVKRLALGGNYYNGATGVKEVSRERADVEASYTHGPVSIAAEYLWGHEGATHRRGWYAQSGYRVGPKWEALFRFDKFDPRQHTSTLTAVNNYVAGTNFFLNSYVKLQANYDRQQDLLAKRSANVVLLQTQFQFGGERTR